jgi:hypothetical protein
MPDQTTPEQTAKEYGQYVAVLPIEIGGALAFAPGDPVPASTVERFPEWLKPTEDTVEPSVARFTTKAAKAVLEDAAAKQNA